MEIDGILTPGSLTSGTDTAAITDRWRLGERLLVEIIKITSEGEGIIRVNDKEMPAFLGTPTKTGEKFWVRVGNNKEGNLLLVREPDQGDSCTAPQPSIQSAQLIERGLAYDRETSNLVRTFLSENMGIFSSILSSVLGASQETMSIESKTDLRKFVLTWGRLSGKTGAEDFIEFLRNIGLNYEQRIFQMQKLDVHAKEAEKESLKNTLKYKLLQLLQNQDGSQSVGNLNDLGYLLQEITSQQLWYKTGTSDNAFVLFHFPLLNQDQFVPAKVAIESARKGSKMDDKHCRIAIQMETEELGEVGIDAYFNENSFCLHILTRNTPFLPQLLDEVLPQTKKSFAKLGFYMEDIEIGDIDKNREFQNFLRGLRKSGVDFQR